MEAAHGGFAVPPRKFTLHFGRAALDIEVPVGAGDRYVSRLHGVFTCDGTHWWLRNEGRLPIQMLGQEPLLLRGYEILMTAGYSAPIAALPGAASAWLSSHPGSRAKRNPGLVVRAARWDGQEATIMPIDRWPGCSVLAVQGCHRRMRQMVTDHSDAIALIASAVMTASLNTTITRLVAPVAWK